MADNEAELPLDGAVTTDTTADGKTIPPDTTTTTAAPTGDTAPPAETPPPAPQTDWRDRQIDRQHRKIKELEGDRARAAELASEVERLKGLVEARDRQQPTTKGTTEPPPESTRQQPTERITASPDEASIRFKIQVEDLGAKMQSEYAKEWPSAVENFKRVSDGIPPTLMQDVLGTDDPAFVLIQLGKDPERYQALLELPPARQRNELFKIAQEKAPDAKPKPRPSSAPTPPEHIVGSTNAPGPLGSIVPDRDDRAPAPQPGQPAQNKFSSSDYDNAWYAERARQKRESKGRPWSFGGSRAGQ